MSTTATQRKAEGRSPSRHVSGPSRDITTPRPGYFKTRLVKGGPYVPCRIWHYRPRVAGADHLAAHILGEPVEVHRVWEGAHEIDRAEYERLMNSRASNPKHPVNLAALAPLF